VITQKVIDWICTGPNLILQPGTNEYRQDGTTIFRIKMEQQYSRSGKMKTNNVMKS
jgi:hypothetical protein